MAAGLAQLRILRDEDPYPELERVTKRLVDGLLAVAAELGVPASGGNLGSMWGMFFAPGPVLNFEQAKTSDVPLFNRFFHGMLDRGVFLAPSQFEAGFTSTAHGDAEIDATIDAAREALRAALG
jgi:glutamate-1-semialdehyde 2,1-aminomutase